MANVSAGFSVMQVVFILITYFGHAARRAVIPDAVENSDDFHFPFGRSFFPVELILPSERLRTLRRQIDGEPR